MSHDSASSHGSLKSYIIGLILSLALTAVSFGYVMSTPELTTTALAVISLAAIAQVLVQIVFFLHLTGKKSQSWESVAGLYTLLSLLFFVVLSLWIFHHLHINTMMIGH
ncbi:cytochrome o ubiquinol oxidase subunit IV [Brackiella oedipodis]|uniref:cytochrome o ubiquinol oxidase subunit IV n=1 Tax=Brackiella oedipodis TaxID=124225 RepID=UPI00048BA614|nr:cytochrome o ubiquinol oxidase subunit IV [Brackiella oedipodis]